MLPDFPELKQTFAQKILRKFEAKRAETIHVFDKARKICLHEGKRLVITHEDGRESEVEIKHIGVEYSITDAECESLTPEQLSAKVEGAAVEMGRKQLQLAYEELNRSVQNEVNLQGQPLNPDHLLRCFEKIWIDFDAEGRPKLPTIIIHPDQSDTYKRIGEEIDSTPELRKRFAQIIASKKEEWRARESNRKLVG
jgi:hypothetical protein